MSQDASHFTFELHPSDKESHFKVNDCTEQKTLSIHLELIQWFTVETPSNFGRMFRICFFFPRERFQKNYIYPFKWSRYHPMVQKFYCERYLSIQSMLGKKEKKYQHFNIFDYTYLPKTDICLFFFLFFSMNLSLIGFCYNMGFILNTCSIISWALVCHWQWHCQIRERLIEKKEKKKTDKCLF